MSLKAELESWAAALKAYDEEDFEKSLDLFSRIADSSKIQTNMGLIYATLGEHEAAVQRFLEATNLDPYLAVAYFQCGVSNFLLMRYEMALNDFEEAHLYLRGNQDINYEQLGLKFRLYSAEVLFNQGLCQVYLGRTVEGLEYMENARRDKATDEHNVIDDAIRDRGEGYTVFSIPVGVLYRPSEKKLKNAVTKDYMGKAKLVAASDPGDAFTEFTGITRLKQGISPTGVFIDRPVVDTNFSANLRSATTSPASADPRLEGVPRLPALERSKITLDILNGPEWTSARRPSPGSSSYSPVAISRNNTIISKSSGAGVPVRGISLRRPGTNPSTASTSAHPTQPQPPTRSAREPPSRITEFYDGYLDSYADQAPVLPIRSGGMPPTSPDRLVAWSRMNADLNDTISPIFASGPRSAPAGNHGRSPSSGVRRKLTRRGTRPHRVQSSNEEEEGYASGDYDDPVFEMIRIKIYYQDDVRGMTLHPETAFEDFMGKLTAKFNKNLNGLGLKFADEDGIKVTLRDESDYELAIETARTAAKGKPEGKLEIWCTDR